MKVVSINQYRDSQRAFAALQLATRICDEVFELSEQDWIDARKKIYIMLMGEDEQ